MFIRLNWQTIADFLNTNLYTECQSLCKFQQSISEIRSLNLG